MINSLRQFWMPMRNKSGNLSHAPCITQPATDQFKLRKLTYTFINFRVYKFYAIGYGITQFVRRSLNYANCKR